MLCNVQQEGAWSADRFTIIQHIQHMPPRFGWFPITSFFACRRTANVRNCWHFQSFSDPNAIIDIIQNEIHASAPGVPVSYLGTSIIVYGYLYHSIWVPLAFTSIHPLQWQTNQATRKHQHQAQRSSSLDHPDSWEHASWKCSLSSAMLVLR